MPLQQSSRFHFVFGGLWLAQLLFIPGSVSAQLQPLQQNDNTLIGGYSGTVTIQSLPKPTIAPTPQSDSINQEATTNVPELQPTTIVPSPPQSRQKALPNQRTINNKNTASVPDQLKHGALQGTTAKLKTRPPTSKFGYKMPVKSRKLPGGSLFNTGIGSNSLKFPGQSGSGPLKTLFPGMPKTGGTNTQHGVPGMKFPGHPGSNPMAGLFPGMSTNNTTNPTRGSMGGHSSTFVKGKNFLSNGPGKDHSGFGSSTGQLPTAADVFGKKSGSFGMFGSRRPGVPAEKGVAGKKLPKGASAKWGGKDPSTGLPWQPLPPLPPPIDNSKDGKVHTGSALTKDLLGKMHKGQHGILTHQPTGGEFSLYAAGKSCRGNTCTTYIVYHNSKDGKYYSRMLNKHKRKKGEKTSYKYVKKSSSSGKKSSKKSDKKPSSKTNCSPEDPNCDPRSDEEKQAQAKKDIARAMGKKGGRFPGDGNTLHVIQNESSGGQTKYLGSSVVTDPVSPVQQQYGKAGRLVTDIEKTGNPGVSTE